MCRRGARQILMDIGRFSTELCVTPVISSS